MRLIDADRLLSELKLYSEIVYECDATSEDDVADCQRANKDNKALTYTIQGLLESVEIINEIPTAYDVDKVVEQLKECERYIYDAVSDEDDYVVNLDKAISIVKGGGQA
jgi:hypothetical protein